MARTDLPSEDPESLILELRKMIWGALDQPYSWYVGAANRPPRGHAAHGAHANGAWFVRRVSSPNWARDFVTYFVRGLGTDGHLDPMGPGPVYVYAYRKDEPVRP